MTDMTRQQVFAELARRNITKVKIGFSGGNDEGGADSTIAVLQDGTESELNTGEISQDWTTKQFSVGYGDQARPATPEEITTVQLIEVLEAPIYEQYGGFAGDYHAYGTLTWDVQAGTVRMHRNDSVETYEESEGPV